MSTATMQRPIVSRVSMRSSLRRSRYDRVGYQLALDLDAAGSRLLGLGYPDGQHAVVERCTGQSHAIVEPAGTPGAPAEQPLALALLDLTGDAQLGIANLDGDVVSLGA